MEPFRHHHNKHHHEEEQEFPPPPPHNSHQPPPGVPFGYEPAPPSFHQPPPPFHGVTSHHHSPPPPHYNDYGGGPSPPPPSQPHVYASGPSYPSVQHVGHQSNNPPPVFPHETHHAPPPQGHHLPSIGHHHQTHETAFTVPPDKPTVRVYTKADTNFSLTIRNGQVVLAPSNPRDDFQHWIKDEKWSTKVKDEENHPSFALINKATGQALKHSIGATQPVQLSHYNQNSFDESVLWSESKDLGDTYRCIRMVNHIKLNLDAFNGDKEHGGVRDGTTAVLWEWKKGDNQRWKIAPYY